MLFYRNTPLYIGLLMAVCCVGGWSVAAADGFEVLRQKMMAEIQADTQETSAYLDKATLDPRVMQVMGRIPRHEFVPDHQKPHAYENRPLSIGYGQTISQPYIVALMTDLLKLEPQHRALEIGTGSGYQAAILAELSEQVYTLEIIEELGRQASQRLDRLGYKNVTCRIADGYYGWERRRAVRCHRGDRGGQPYPRTPAQAVEAGRAHGDTDRRPLPGAATDADREDCRTARSPIGRSCRCGSSL